jgi:hypothetical protein
MVPESENPDGMSDPVLDRFQCQDGIGEHEFQKRGDITLAFAGDGSGKGDVVGVSAWNCNMFFIL